MAEVPIYLRHDQLTRRLPAATCYTRTSVLAPWTLHEDLICETCEFTIGGAIGTASLRHHYGRIQRKGATQYTNVGPLDITNHLLRIDIVEEFLTVDTTGDRLDLELLVVGTIVHQLSDGKLYRFLGPKKGEKNPANWTEYTESPRTQSWYGMIDGERRNHHGSEVGLPSGDQMFSAHSMDVFLARNQITQSWVDTDGAGTMNVVSRGLAFNSFKSDGRLNAEYLTGNKSALGLGFAYTANDAVEWTSNDILDYLGAYFSPVDSQLSIHYEHDADLGSNCQHIVPVNVQTHGATVLDLMASVVDRRRGFGWRLAYNGSSTLTFKNVSFSEEEIEIDDLTLSANPYIRTLDISGTPGLVCIESEDSLRSYDRVVVEGGLIGSVFTLSVTDGTLTKDWTAADETSYALGASNDAGYATWDKSKKASENDSKRMSDDLRQTYTRFVIPATWDYRVKDGVGGTSQHAVFPQIPDEGYPDDTGTESVVWRGGFRLKNYLPLKARVDYTIAGTEPPDYNPPNVTPDLRRPYVIMPQTRKDGDETWVAADSYSAAMAHDELTGNGGGSFSSTVSVHDYQAGVSVTPHGVPHLNDRTTGKWDGTVAANKVSHKKSGETDYRRIICTVYAQSDTPLSASYPPNPVRTQADLTSTLYVRLGDRKRVDYMPSETVVGIAGGQPSRTVVPRFIRDDRESIQNLARASWQWYSKAHSSVELSVDLITNQFQVGHFLKSLKLGKLPMFLTQDGQRLILQNVGGASNNIVWKTQNGWSLVTQDGRSFISSPELAPAAGNQPRLIKQDPEIVRQVNTVISRVLYDFERGATRVQTQYQELDVGVLA